MRFTALLHHLTVELLWDSFYALKRKAASPFARKIRCLQDFCAAQLIESISRDTKRGKRLQITMDLCAVKVKPPETPATLGINHFPNHTYAYAYNQTFRAQA